MKKSTLFRIIPAVLFAVLPALLVPEALSAFDLGLSIDNSSTLRFGGGLADPDFEQRNRAALWLESSWTGETGALYTFSAQGSFLYTSEPLFKFDVDRLVLRGKFPGLLGEGTVADGAAGRFRFREPTGLVLNHPADGIFFGSDHGSFRWGVTAGYTGLLLKPESGIEVSAADSADKADDDVKFAPKRLLQIGEIAFPRIIPRQLLTAAVAAQQDLRDGDELHSLHGIMTLSGTVMTGLYHDAAGVFQYDISGEQGCFMGSVNIRYFRQDWAYSRFALGVLYAGEKFFTISAPDLGLVHTPGLSDLFRLSLSYSVRPWGDRLAPSMRNLQFLAGGRLFIIPSDGYSGAELDGGVNFRPASDFGASLRAGIYLPDEGDPTGLVRFEFSLGF